MNSHHQKLLAEIQKHKGNGTKYSSDDNYLGSGHVYYHLSVPLRRTIAKEWFKQNRDISNKEFILTLNSLYKATSHEEKTIASILLSYSDKHRKAVTPKHLNSWLNHLVGWAEIDFLCQNVFTADELLSNWKEWKAFIIKLSKDRNINKRRASLVFLTGPTHRSNDMRLQKLAFENIDRLKSEKEILITKAISWLLREMSTMHKKAVTLYLKENESTLPKIAVRETKRKLQTGRK